MKKKLFALTLLAATSLSMTTPVFATSDTLSSQEPSQILYHGISVEEARERFSKEYPGQEFKLEYVANGLGGMNLSEASLTTGDTAIALENQPLSEIPVIEEGLEVTTSVSGSSNKLTTSESGIKVLPKTSDTNSLLGFAGFGLVIMGGIGFKKKEVA